MRHSNPNQLSSNRSLHRKKTLQLLLLAFPAILLIFVFNYIPMAGIVIAFKNINYAQGIFKSPWVGFDNFHFFFTSKDAWLVVRNTLGYNLGFIAIGNVISVIFALMLNEVSSRRWIKFYQTTFFFPFFFSWVIVSYMVFIFFSGNPSGVLVNLLALVHVDISDFYINSRYWPPFMLFLGIWKGLGYTSVIYYASIMGLPAEFFEAAEIDGATKRQIIWHITLPQIVPTITILVLLSIGKIFYSDFGLFYFVPANISQLFSVTQTIDTYIFRMLKVSGDIGMSAAVGAFQSVIGLVLVLFSNFAVRKISPDNSAF